MASTGTYLNFTSGTEAAFLFYKAAFGTEFVGGIMRHGDVPGAKDLTEAQKQLVMNVQLPITGGHLLMGSDVPEFTGYSVNQGNSVYICINPDSRTESDRIFAALSEGGTVDQAPAEMFWGDYFGTWVDKFGVSWMLNCTSKE